VSDCEGIGFCFHCKAVRYFFLSGSATKGTCMTCGSDREFRSGEVHVTYHQDADESYAVEEGIE